MGQSNFGATIGGLVKVAGPFTSVLNAIITLLGKLLSLPGAPQVIGTLLALAAAAKTANKATGGLMGVMGKTAGQSFQMANTIATLITQTDCVPHGQAAVNGCHGGGHNCAGCEHHRHDAIQCHPADGVLSS